MKVAALAAFGVLIAFSAGAAQQQRQSVSPATTCDNDGHCKTASADAAPAVHRIRPKPQKMIASVVQPLPQPRPSQTDTQSQQDQPSEQQSQETQQTEQNQDPQQAKQEPQRPPEQARQIQQAQRPQLQSQQLHALDANGNKGIVISHKTGARARVGVAYAARFQAYIDDLENNHGARVLFMNGIRPGRCSPASEHPCGKALDVCQHRRGVVDPRCNLPGRVALGHIASVHGLFEGGRWCNSDYGHAQVGVTAAACGDRFRLVQRQNSVPALQRPTLSSAGP
ncbi:MAG TPA: hypothetical protein VM822_11885 [Pseudolabrys sp.]|nr:hypothetical protein [Pseudolabrys sp.]